MHKTIAQFAMSGFKMSQFSGKREVFTTVNNNNFCGCMPESSRTPPVSTAYILFALNYNSFLQVVSCP